MEGGCPSLGGDSHLADGAFRDDSGFGRTESGDIGRRTGRSEKFLFPDLQRGFIAGRALLQMILASYCNCGPEDLCFLLRRLSKARAQIERPPFANSGVQPFSFRRRNSDRDSCRRIPRHRFEHLDARAGGSALVFSRQARDRPWTRGISRASSG